MPKLGRPRKVRRTRALNLRPGFFFFPGTRQSPSLTEPAFLMTTSASVALWWNRGLLNHTAEPLKSLAVGSAQPSDHKDLATLQCSKEQAGRGEGNVGEVATFNLKSIHSIQTTIFSAPDWKAHCQGMISFSSLFHI